MFVYEMISRWLLPLQQLRVVSFIATEARMHERLVMLSSMRVAPESPDEQKAIEAALPTAVEELKLGLSSSYHAKRILEIKGLSISDKMGFVLDHLRNMIQRFPDRYDYDVIPLMQRFFIHVPDEYRMNRSVASLERTILSMYSMCAQVQKAVSGQKSVYVRVRKTMVTSLFGEKNALLLTVGVTQIRETERLTKEQLKKSIVDILPDALVDEQSMYVEQGGESAWRVYSFEVTPTNACSISFIRMLERRLPAAILARIEQLTLPLVMPSNDEEVMKQMALLSGQLTSPRDIPQLILSFREQTETKLVFQGVVARILKASTPKIDALLASDAAISVEKVRERGRVWKKYPKEIALLTIELPLEKNQSRAREVNFLHARKNAFQLLKKYFGEIRDYYGGMYEKELHLLNEVNTLLKEKNVSTYELDRFYQHLFPTEYRAIFSAEHVAILYELFQRVRQGDEEYILRQGRTGMYGMRSFPSVPRLRELMKDLRLQPIPRGSVLIFSSEDAGEACFGWIDLSREGQFQSILQKALAK